MANFLGRYFIFIVILVAIGVLSACRPEPVASGDANVLILQPSADSIIHSSSVTVRTFIENFKLVDKPGQANMEGEGHLIFYKDVTPTTHKGESALTTETSYILSIEKSYTWENVTEGQHQFWVQLVNNDNTCLEPPAAVRVPVRVVSN
jgi:hypothetical protein